jgi:hypothetical protein
MFSYLAQILGDAPEPKPSGLISSPHVEGSFLMKKLIAAMAIGAAALLSVSAANAANQKGLTEVAQLSTGSKSQHRHYGHSHGRQHYGHRHHRHYGQSGHRYYRQQRGYGYAPQYYGGGYGGPGYGGGYGYGGPSITFGFGGGGYNGW